MFYRFHQRVRITIPRSIFVLKRSLGLSLSSNQDRCQALIYLAILPANITNPQMLDKHCPIYFTDARYKNSWMGPRRKQYIKAIDIFSAWGKRLYMYVISEIVLIKTR